MNKTEIQVNAIIAELRAQRNEAGDHAANIAAELAVVRSEKALLEGQVKNLKEQLELAEIGGLGDNNRRSESAQRL